jgi:hypothetical protein
MSEFEPSAQVVQDLDLPAMHLRDVNPIFLGYLAHAAISLIGFHCHLELRCLVPLRALPSRDV